MKIKVGMISLGCAKNQVDGEVLMGTLKNNGFETVMDPALADIAIVNTCGFIDSAKRESIEEILELCTLKKEGKIKKIVVTGCLAERYQREIHRDIPEVDAVVGIGANGDIAALLDEMLGGKIVESFPDKYRLPLCGARELTTPSYFAYLKIAEGCDNRCTYCAIPEIRGNYRSRPLQNILEEAEELVKNGAKEIILIAQDTTRYGIDLYNEYSLPKLLRALCKIKDLKWIRTLYCYPDVITDELLAVMAEEKKVVKYMDIPLQHGSAAVLKAMNRRGDRKSLTALLKKIREKVPGIILRTTVIAGFPGETPEDFEELCQFIKEIRFDRLGCFAYSQEEGTVAGAMENQIPEEEKQHRAELVTELQMRIMDENNQRYIGKTLEVLVEGFDRYAECYFGRSYMDSPDVDGKIFFSAGTKKPAYGQMIKVKIEDAMDADLMGSAVYRT
ncbi:MAG: 30S ribosomal protein S12 methylthiotransferase RimO [Oscillospiraceae bacterium]